MASGTTPWVFGILCICACGDDGSPEATGSSSSTTATSSTATSSTSSTTGSADETSGLAESESTSSSTDPSTGPDTSGTSSSGSDSGSSSSGDPEPPNGCADGEREALTEEDMYPDIAACSGGWEIPGVLVNTAYCRRQGGDDGPNPMGTRCSVEDLCSEGWHVCDGLDEVTDGGVSNCNDVFWNGAFFVTRQSSEGSNTCTPTGLNDVFGCGDIGYENIMECAPLNRGSANLCVTLPKPWLCPESLTEEAEFIRKAGPQFGGALCCRD